MPDTIVSASGYKTSLSNGTNCVCFFSACKEVQDKLQVCSSLVALLEDVSSVEKTAGTQLVKIGSNSSGGIGGSGGSNGGGGSSGGSGPYATTLTSAMQDTLSSMSSIAAGTLQQHPKEEALLASLVTSWEGLLHSSATTRGKLSVNLASNIVQGICRPIPEQVKTLSKRLASVLSKVQPQTEKLTKAKLDAQRHLEIYQKLSSDTAAAIRARDSPNGEVSDNISSPSSRQRDGEKKDAFVNRAMNKLISKINPTTSQVTDRRIAEMCRELDAAERQLDQKTGKINDLQQHVEALVLKALSELDECEGVRMHFMKDALLRLHIAQDFCVREGSDSVQSLSALLESVNSDEDISKLVAEIDRPVGTPSSADRELEARSNTEIDDLVARMNKATEALDYFRALTNKALESLSDIADVDKQYCKSLLWTLDKHGYSRSDRSSGLRQLARQIQQLGQAPCSVLMSSVESPSIRKGYEATFKALGNIADLAGRSAEDSEIVSAKLETMQRRLEAMRKDVVDKIAQNVRKIDIASQGASKAAQKCLKVQREIKEKKMAVRKARDEALPGALSQQAPSSPSPQPPVDRAQTPSPDQDPRGRTSTGLDSIMENLGSTLRTHTEKLGVVVGLESENDRLLRIEGKIALLETEEKGLADGMRKADFVAASAIDSARAELSSLLNAAKEFLCSDFDAMKSAIKALATGKVQYAALTRETIISIRAAYEHVDLEQDMHYFVSTVTSNAETQDGEDADLLSLCFSPELRNFTPESVKCIEDERKMLEIPPFIHKPYVFASLLHPFGSPSIGRKTVDEDEIDRRERVMSRKIIPGSHSTSHSVSPPRDSSGELHRSPNDGSPDGDSDPLARPHRRRTRSTGSMDETKGDTLPNSGSPRSPDAGSYSVSYTPDSGPGKIYADGSKAGLDYAKFGLSASDKVLGSFSCAYYPKKGMLTHGRMFVLQHYLAYGGWPDTYILIPVKAIEGIEKMNTLQIFPNALMITCKSGEGYFFGTFVEREKCFALIQNLFQVARELAGLNLPTTEMVDSPESPNNRADGRTSVERVRHQVDVVDRSSPDRGPSESGYVRTSTERQNGSSPEKHAGGSTSLVSIFPSADSFRPPSATTSPVNSTALTAGEIAPSSPSSSSAGSRENATSIGNKPRRRSQPSDSPDSPPSTAASTGFSLPKEVGTPASATFVAVDDNVRLNDLFDRSNVFLLHSQVLEGACKDLWSACWLQGRGYADFLDQQGDLLVMPGEWEPLQQRCPEDITRLPFTHVRPFSYSHPRTTMLMFGPKNAPATQKQYLYLHSAVPPLVAVSDSTIDQLAAKRPTRGCVLTITQFDGIPMADVFKVMHYWTFETVPDPTSLEGTRTQLRIGVAVHFIKNSMLKSQISSGVRDELGVLSRQWCSFAEQRVAMACKRRSLGELAQTLKEVRNSRRYSLKELADAGIVTEVAADGEEGITIPANVLSQSAGGAGAAAGPSTSENTMLLAIALLFILLLVQFFYNRWLLGELGKTTDLVQAVAKTLQEQAAIQAKIVKALRS